MLHRLGTFRMDQTVLLPATPLYRLEHLRKQPRSNNGARVTGIAIDANFASTPSGRFPPGRSERASGCESFARAFRSSTRVYRVPQDLRRRSDPYIPAVEPSDTRGLVQRIKLCATWGNRSHKRRCRATSFIPTQARKVDSLWTEMHQPFSKIDHGHTLFPIEILHFPFRTQDPFQHRKVGNLTIGP